MGLASAIDHPQLRSRKCLESSDVRGTKTEIRSGVWRLRAVVGYDPKTGNPRQVSKTIKGTSRTADSELARFVADVDAGSIPLSASLSVAQYLDRWLNYVKPTRQ